MKRIVAANDTKSATTMARHEGFFPPGHELRIPLGAGNAIMAASRKGSRHNWHAMRDSKGRSRLFGPFRPICSAVSAVLRDGFASAPLDAFPIVGQIVGQTAVVRQFRCEAESSALKLKRKLNQSQDTVQTADRCADFFPVRASFARLEQPDRVYSFS